MGGGGREVGQFADLRIGERAWQEKGVGVFEEGRGC